MVKCKICDSSKIFSKGKIFHPKPEMVAGNYIDLNNQDFFLIACRNCGFHFKYPDLPINKLKECYSLADKDVWGTHKISNKYRQSRRIDFIEHLIMKNTCGRKILDVGCADGSMLAHFVGNWEKYGVEVGRSSASKASSRDIHVLGEYINEINPTEYKFDVITSFDVVEHLLDPLEFFLQSKKLLNYGGIILTVTGDTCSLPWRLLGSLTWYCTLVEHASFFNHSSMKWLSDYLNLQEVEYHLLSHHTSDTQLIIRDLFAFSGYKIGRICNGFGIPSIQEKLNRGAPSWFSARDHLFHIMKFYN